MESSRFPKKIMDISKSLWNFLDVLESYEHLLERESLEASNELYKRRSSPQAWSNQKEATQEHPKGVKPL